MVGRAVYRIALVAALAPGAALAAGEAPHPFLVTEMREPCAAHAPLRSPFFGDLHVHTRFSQDASTQGTRNGPRDAYRFARGEALGIQPYDAQGRPLRHLKLDRPLDFAAVTDHAELLGEVEICRTPGLAGLRLVAVLDLPRASARRLLHDEHEELHARCGALRILRPEGGRGCLDAARVPWQEIQAAAEGAYDRTLGLPLHELRRLRVDGLDRHQQPPPQRDLPQSSVCPSFRPASTRRRAPRRCGRRCAESCLERGDGCDLIAIPHNSNLSNGLMFETVRAGRPADHAAGCAHARRARAAGGGDAAQGRLRVPALAGHDRRAVRLREAPVCELRAEVRLAASRSAARCRAASCATRSAAGLAQARAARREPVQVSG